MDGEDVGLLDALRVDALVALHMRQRREPVAVDRGALEIEVLRRPAASRAEISVFTFWLRPDRKSFASLDQFGIVVGADLAGAGAGAALDLVEQAGPRAALEDASRCRCGAGTPAAAS